MIRSGVDLVDISRLEQVLGEWPRLEGRLFTVGERTYSKRRLRRIEHLAARFAAKEAAFKALGTGWPHLGYHEVEVIPGDDGPRLRLGGRAAAMAGNRAVSLSLAHDGGFAVAQVILLGEEDAASR